MNLALVRNRNFFVHTTGERSVSAVKIETNIETILDLTDRPSFCVSGGTILAANQAALDHNIQVGTGIDSLLYAGKEAYAEFSEGHLYLSLWINGECCDASVTCFSNTHLFCLESSKSLPEFQAYARAAQELRIPLSTIMGVSDRVFPALARQCDASLLEHLSYMNRGMYHLLRIVSNMSDAASCGTTRMELMDVSAVFSEIMDHVTMLCQHIDIQIRVTGHPLPLYSYIDEQKLERSIYNLISNAIRNSRPGGVIDVSLSLNRKNICITVTDAGSDSNRPLTAGAFRQFLREPSLEVFNTGLGLGVPLIRAAALAHNGTFLMRQVDNGVRAVFSFPIQQRTDALHSSPLRLDYAGERDHGLLELAEFLPVELYDPRNL